jgi:DNA polymerase-4
LIQRQEILCLNRWYQARQYHGVPACSVAPHRNDDPADLVDQRGERTAAAEHAVDRLREKFGRAAVIRGIALDEDGAE